MRARVWIGAKFQVWVSRSFGLGSERFCLLAFLRTFASPHADGIMPGMQAVVQPSFLSIFLVSDQPEHLAQWRQDLSGLEIHEAGQVPELLLGLKEHPVSWVVLDAGLKLGWFLFAKTLLSATQVPLVVLGQQVSGSLVSQVRWVRNVQELRSLLGLPGSDPTPSSVQEPWQQETLINEEVLARTLGYKSDRIAAVIRQQIEELPAKIHAWSKNHNAAEIQREAHALKGAFGSIGCVRLWRGFEATDFDAKRGGSCRNPSPLTGTGRSGGPDHHRCAAKTGEGINHGNTHAHACGGR